METVGNLDKPTFRPAFEGLLDATAAPAPESGIETGPMDVRRPAPRRLPVPPPPDPRLPFRRARLTGPFQAGGFGARAARPRRVPTPRAGVLPPVRICWRIARAAHRGNAPG